MQRRKNKRKGGGKRRRGGPYSPTSTSIITSVNNPQFGFIQPRIKTTLKYNQVLSFTVATTVGTQNTFRANSLSNPDTGGAGHQPYGHDTLASLYNNYRVVKFKWDVEFTPSSDRMVIGVIPYNDALSSNVTNLATFNLAAESPFAQTKTLAFDGGAPSRFRGSIACNKLVGSSAAQYLADDRFAASFGNNPTDNVGFAVILYNPSSGSVTLSVNCTFWFEAIVYDPKLLAQS